MKKSTEELLKILKHTPDLNTYFSEEQENISARPLHECLTQLCIEKDISPGQCIRLSGLDRTYGYQIFSGVKTPSRDKVLALCYGLKLSLDGIQALLKSAGYPILYPKNERDSVIIFALQRSCSLTDLNELLYDLGHDLLR